VYLGLPPPRGGAGQIVAASGDVLLLFDPRQVDLSGSGFTGTACRATPVQASAHGVFCTEGHVVRLFLQKPGLHAQRACGAVDEQGMTLLDAGLVAFDHRFAARLLALAGFDVRPAGEHTRARIAAAESPNPVARAIASGGLDIYREIACAMGRDVTWEHYRSQVRAAGSTAPDEALRMIFEAVRSVPFNVCLLPQSRFLHFGASDSVVESAGHLVQRAGKSEPFLVNTVLAGGAVRGGSAWVEGCRVGAEVVLDGLNLLVGVRVDRPLRLREGIALDLLPTHDSGGGATRRFLRIYGVHDTFKGSVAANDVTFLNRPIDEWLRAVGVGPEAVWPPDAPPDERSLWNARLFPLIDDDSELYDWLWMQQPETATEEQRRAWLRARRFSVEQMQHGADHRLEQRRRQQLRLEVLERNASALFAAGSSFSARDLAGWMSMASDPCRVLGRIARVAAESYQSARGVRTNRQGMLKCARILHTLGSAMGMLTEADRSRLACAAAHDGLLLAPGVRAGMTPDELKRLAFDLAAEAITGLRCAPRGAEPAGGAPPNPLPKLCLRADEIVWARSPVRLDVAGGWTDTPPYTLENGGRVVNVAVNLNNQRPVLACVRAIDERLIRLGSIDRGSRIEVRALDELLDYRSSISDFALAKGALALVGFSPGMAPWPEGITLEGMLDHAGGGLEVSTLCAVPKGSGLGTSSILGATVLAALLRALGRPAAGRELFEAVLHLEQMLTTGGGWQDQAGGLLPGVKYISTEPGFAPDLQAYYLPADLLCPSLNGGTTLLYYTGFTRVAKNILQEVVGRYLDRDRTAMRTLEGIRRLADEARDAISRKQPERFGQVVARAWELNKRLDPRSTSDDIDEIMGRIGPHVHGAKLLGAGGGGFLLMVCKSSSDARTVREELTQRPPNERARFFDFKVDDAGLEVVTS